MDGKELAMFQTLTLDVQNMDREIASGTYPDVRTVSTVHVPDIDDYCPELC